MKNILITGGLGQIGTELTEYLRSIYGIEHVVTTNRSSHGKDVEKNGPFELLDVRDGKRLHELVKKYNIDSVIHLAALLSAVGEGNPQLLWDVNMNGLYNVLEVARQENLQVFTPSSIASFGKGTPLDFTPQDTVQRPSTIYGVSKVAGELLCDYYYHKYKVDARGLRYPGLISNVAMPGGGTTDYAVTIFYEALKSGKYTCYLKADTMLDMMYMPDALDAIVKLMEVDGQLLSHRNAFNITAMTFTPHMLLTEIKKHLPNFEMDYEIDPLKQSIADSWPNSMDDRCARLEWGFEPKFTMQMMVEDMIQSLRKKI